MFDLCGMNLGLGSLGIARETETRSISAENPEGKKGAGATAPSNLGVGWKGRPFILLGKDSTTTLAQIDGPGVIQHIWMTVPDKGPNGATVLRDLVLRFYWDGEESPSVEVPFGDFFANGHAMRCNVNSLPVSVNPNGGMNCYWPMPFRTSVRITVTNEHGADLNLFFYQIDYALGKVPDNVVYLHAQWRRENPVEYHKKYTILDGVKGRGHYVGTYFTHTQLIRYGWGEAEIEFFIDGDTNHPTICGTGTEDYVGGAWSFGADTTYSTPFLGFPFFYSVPGQPNTRGMYRWHVLDPITFRSDIRVTLQDIAGHPHGDGWEPHQDDISSVAYWYQTEPHAPFPELPAVKARVPR